MKTIILIDDQAADQGQDHSEWLRDIPDTKVIAIPRTALSQTLSDNQADLAVVNLASALADDHQVLRCLDNQQVPAIAYGQQTQEEADLLDRFAVFNCLSNSEDTTSFSAAIKKIFTKSGVAHICGVSLTSFLQLLELDRKTCTLRIKSNGQRGVLYFVDGEIFDAHTEQTIGEEAALAIVGWAPAEIDLHESCRKQERRITSSLGFLLIEGARRKDEEGSQSSQETGTGNHDNSTEQHIPPEAKNDIPAEYHSPSDLPEQALKTLQRLAAAIMELNPAGMLIAKKDGTVLSEHNSDPQLNSLAVQTAVETDSLSRLLNYTGPQYILLHHAKEKKLLILTGEEIMIALEITVETPAQIIVASLAPLLKRLKLNLNGNQC